MATRRMWIKNTKTGDRILLAKRFLSGWELYKGETELSPSELFERADFASEDFVIEYTN